MSSNTMIYRVFETWLSFTWVGLAFPSLYGPKAQMSTVGEIEDDFRVISSESSWILDVATLHTSSY